jgi:eukaryotic-like serine/threonine-protein kinase
VTTAETKRDGSGPLAATSRFEPTVGTVVADKYRVEGPLGEGGMGTVVLATHVGLDQRVAIKFLLPEALKNKDAVERFFREAKVAARIRSDHVARVHDVGTLESGVPYIVMEYLEGSDLGGLIDRKRGLPIEESCEIALQACEALTEVHAAGIVHRDLKPTNLFVTRRADGSPAVKLLDFGISKLASNSSDAIADTALTATTAIMGSPSYMSPEQIKSTKEVDHRSDVWSLGTVLYEALTGKPAFRGESLPAVCAMIASEDPVAPSTIRQELPAELEGAVLACLRKSPDERASLVDLARVLASFAPPRARVSLDRIEATMGTSATVRAPSSADRPFDKRIEKPKSIARRMPRVPRKRTWLLLLSAGGVLAVGAYMGTLAPSAVRSEVSGATSVVASAASAAASAAGAAASAIASALPEIAPPPDPASSVHDDLGEAPVATRPSASAGPGAPGGAANANQGPHQPAPHHGKPHHGSKQGHVR